MKVRIQKVDSVKRDNRHLRCHHYLRKNSSKTKMADFSITVHHYKVPLEYTQPCWVSIFWFPAFLFPLSLCFLPLSSLLKHSQIQSMSDLQCWCMTKCSFMMKILSTFQQTHNLGLSADATALQPGVQSLTSQVNSYRKFQI